MTDSTLSNIPAPTHRESAATDTHHDDHDHHPTEAQYWKVFVTLVILTALEVLWSYLGLSGPALVVPLLLMMVIKFVIVGGAFMHLYFDLKIVNGKWFTWAFASAIILAIAVYMVVFAAFEFNI